MNNFKELLDAGWSPPADDLHDDLFSARARNREPFRKVFVPELGVEMMLGAFADTRSRASRGGRRSYR